MKQQEIDSLLPTIYNDLKRLARIQRSRVYSKKNLGTRSIVHEAYLNIIKNQPEIENSQQLLYYTSISMRNIIIDNARSWQAKKRGGNNIDLSLEQVELISAKRSDELINLDEALKQLKKDNKRMVDIVTCRFFGGLTQEETSKALNISVATIKREWTLAKALLFEKLAA